MLPADPFTLCKITFHVPVSDEPIRNRANARLLRGPTRRDSAIPPAPPRRRDGVSLAFPILVFVSCLCAARGISRSEILQDASLLGQSLARHRLGIAS